MATVVIAGGGFAGLAASLLCARRGHEVTVIERDAPPPGDSPDADAEGWARPGAPQSRQSHALLGRAAAVLSEAAPDVVDALVARGVCPQPIPVRGGGATMLLTRRLVAEAVLRRLAAAEPGVAIRSPDAVVGLEARPGPDGVPVACGVRTAAGEVIGADLVVDAGGRRSALPAWLAAIGARPPVDERQELGFFYLTRYYRDRPGRDHPATRIPGAIPLDYANVMAFGADNGTFSLSLTLSVDDPHRQALRDPERFERFFAAVPFTREWLQAGTPITDVSTMARIENRRRRLVDGAGPVVGGLVSLGDAALHTNPTLGRGISLAFAQAHQLAGTAGAAVDDPVGFVAGFDAWTQDHLGVWYDTQVATDAGGLARLAAGLEGRRLPPPADGPARRVAAAFALSKADPVVFDATQRLAHLLLTPAAALSAPGVAERIDAFLESGPDLDRPPDEPSRAEFESIAAG